jgi:phosphatidate cytidylyltransferase
MAADAPKKPSNLRTRLLAAATLLPLVLAWFVWGPSWLVIIFLLICMALCVGETAMMLLPAFERRLAVNDGRLRHLEPEQPTAPMRGKALMFPGIAVLLGAIALLASTAAAGPVPIGALSLCVTAGLLIGTFSAKSIDLAATRAFGILMSLCYGALPWLVVWQLYLLAPHARYILLVMAVTWMGDTGGYFGGRYYGGKIFGNRKLAPVISPKKTWEGAVLGLILSVVASLGLNLFFLGALGSYPFIARLALVGGIAAQLGDLVESTFKRFAGVKDSGQVIPGHGGFLDRVDGILFAAPVIWAILYYFR